MGFLPYASGITLRHLWVQVGQTTGRKVTLPGSSLIRNVWMDGKNETHPAPNSTSNLTIIILPIIKLPHFPCLLLIIKCHNVESRIQNILGFAGVLQKKFLFQQVKLPSLGEHECHFKDYWMKVSFALGCQRWRCHGNSFYCYQSSTVWQVNHLFI